MLKKPDIKVPPPHDWRTTDVDEINKRRLRAREERFAIKNLDPRHPIFSNFQVISGSGQRYTVEVRDVGQRQFACNCVDFRINGLGTCKHVEAVLLHLESRFRRLFASAVQSGSTRIEVVVDRASETLRVLGGCQRLPRTAARWFSREGLLTACAPEAALEALRRLASADMPEIRISQEADAWLENRQHAGERLRLRREYEHKVQSGEWPSQETKTPLFPYQREGMLHLAFAERALLADEMGLGKTIQAIAACALLHRLGQARRVLVITPASLKTEWEEQIQRFTSLPYQLVYGGRFARLNAYADAPFFTLVNYEQMVTDALDVNERLRPDIIVLDEAQRIKNWSTKTAQAVKRLRSRYAFVLTGTPIENRIDELHSLMDFLNPSVLGPLFRFNRDFYDLDERGRPRGYRNLDQLHQRIKPYMLRRRKADVETELPERTDRNHFVPLTDLQKQTYADHEHQVAKLMQIAQRRPLRKEEQDKLQRELAMMRMICDTNYILDPEDRACPKLAELEKVLDTCRENGVKAIVFSEWERMLELVRERCETMRLGFAWHTGSVPQQHRRAEINDFKNNPECRVFLSTDSGATGLNLQNASVVVNCDLPWNPAKLEQRIARAWRKNQSKPVTVINLVAENTIESRMLGTLANKKALADGVLDLQGNLKEIKLGSGKAAFMEKLNLLVGTSGQATAPSVFDKPSMPADRAAAFAQRTHAAINGSLVLCEERHPNEGAHTVMLVVVDANPSLHQARLAALHTELLGPSPSDPQAPSRLEIIDRATHEALERLMAAGLIQSTTRARRPLWPNPEPAVLQPLSAEERAQAARHRAQAARKLKMARLLGDGGMAEEARVPLLEATHALAKALAIESRLPEPEALKDIFLPPLSSVWKEASPLLRTFHEGEGEPWQPVAEVLAIHLKEAHALNQVENKS